MARRTLRLAGRAASEQIIQVCTDREGVRLVAVGELHALEYRQESLGLSMARALIPLKALAIVAADSDEESTISEVWQGATTVQWKAGQVPISKKFDPVDETKVKLLPTDPVEWTLQPQEFLFALRETFRTTDDVSSRFAMTCVQIRGENGDIAATDGRSLYLQGGFEFPFRESLLVRPTRVFERDDLFGLGPVHIGIAGDTLALRSGPWHLYLSLHRDGRFPRIDSVVPYVDGDTPTVELEPNDRAFLVENLKRLPGSEDVNQPVTVDLHGKPTIRASEPSGSTMEYLLRGSERLGGDTRVASDRRYLERAAKLGFAAVSFTGTESPVVCRDGYRTFVWAALDKSQIVPPLPGAVVIETGEAAKHRRRRSVAAI